MFEGPFDLLLHLILREQVDLYEIDLITIVDAYLAQMEKFEALDLDVATEFLLIAATLVELKSKRLLPDDEDIDLDDELALWEERDLLLARLVECKTFKDAAHVLERLHRLAGMSTPRRVGPDERFVGLTPDVLAGVSPEDLREAFLRAVEPKPEPVIDLVHVAPIRVSVVDAVANLCVELPSRGRMSFRDLTSGLTDRIDVVVHFLAILEMFKQGLVDLRQPRTFGDIEIRWCGGEVSAGEALELVDAYDG